MSTELDVLVEARDNINAAIDAHKVELAAQELPEVWYLHQDGDCGAMYEVGCTHNADNWLHKSTGLTRHTRGVIDGIEGFKKVTKAEYNNVKALYHGADFTGRLDQIDVPVCELNQATRDEMFALPFNSFEARTTIGEGGWFELYATNDAALCHNLADSDYTEYIFRLRAPKTRPMTRKEVLAWAASADAFGWVVRCETEGLKCPQQLVYDMAIRRYQRARIITLNDDGTGGTWEAFEVPAK